MRVTVGGTRLVSDWKTGIIASGAKSFRTSAVLSRPRIVWNGNPFCDPDTKLYLPGIEGTGATIYDYSGNKNNGAISGATWTQLPSGLWYLFFDGATGADDLVTVTDAASIQNIWDAGGTIEVWINPGSDGEGDLGKIFRKQVGLVGGWIFGVASEAAGSVKLSFGVWFDASDGIWASTNTVCPVNTWSKIAITYNSSSAANDPTMYVNGVSVGVTETIPPIGTRETDVGMNLILGNNAATSQTFDGGQALWKAYKSIKTPAQVLSEFNQERHLFGV